VKAPKLFYRGLELLYSEKPDEAKAEELFVESLESDPTAFFVAVELGNLRAKHGQREEAIRAFEVARANAPPGNKIIELLTRQIERISKEPPESVPPIRNPFFE
jgi:lipopolysaccharide biosynthesis regulator YciM